MVNLFFVVFAALLAAQVIGVYVVEYLAPLEVRPGRRTLLRLAAAFILSVTVLTAIGCPPVTDLRLCGLLILALGLFVYGRPYRDSLQSTIWPGRTEPRRWMTMFVLQILVTAVAAAFARTGFEPDELQTHILIPLYLLGGVLATVPFGGVLISRLTQPALDQLDENELNAGLHHGGRTIGYLERGLIFLLVFIGLPSGIGFLLAAKSILRFGEIKDGNQRKVAEYIIIGTLMSFGWALLVATLTDRILRMTHIGWNFP